MKYLSFDIYLKAVGNEAPVVVKSAISICECI